MPEDVLTILGRIDERTEKIEKDVDHLMQVVVLGNGSKALMSQMATMTEKVSSLELSAAEKRIPRHVLLGLVVSTAIGLAALLAPHI